MRMTVGFPSIVFKAGSSGFLFGLAVLMLSFFILNMVLLSSVEFDNEVISFANILLPTLKAAIDVSGVKVLQR